jgi:hypothetical protein
VSPPGRAKLLQAGRFVRKLHNDERRLVSKGLPATLPRAMHHVSTETLIQAILAIGVLIGLMVVGVLIVQSFRGGATDKGTSANELLTNFQEMRSRGDIDDGDYRKIKSVLGAQLHQELKDDKDKG